MQQKREEATQAQEMSQSDDPVTSLTDDALQAAYFLMQQQHRDQQTADSVLISDGDDVPVADLAGLPNDVMPDAPTNPPQPVFR